jgi:hypothetical protein
MWHLVSLDAELEIKKCVSIISFGSGRLAVDRDKTYNVVIVACTDVEVEVGRSRDSRLATRLYIRTRQ